MGSLVVAVMLVSGGLAMVGRCIEAGGEAMWTIPSAIFFLGVALASVGTFLLARAVTNRSHRSARAASSSPYSSYVPWAAHPAGNDDATWRRARPASRDEMPGLALSRDDVKEAARMLIFAGQEELDRIARARRAERSACRRGHTRRSVAAPEPKRRRVRVRPRMFM